MESMPRIVMTVREGREAESIWVIGCLRGDEVATAVDPARGEPEAGNTFGQVDLHRVAAQVGFALEESVVAVAGHVAAGLEDAEMVDGDGNLDRIASRIVDL